MSSSAAQLVASALLRRGIFSGLQTSRSLVVIPQHTSSILGQTSLFSTDAGNNESSSSFASTSGGASQGERTYRSGVVAVKVGMTQEWDHWGMRIPLTVLWLDECEVVQVKTQEKEGYTGLQLGCGSKRRKQLPPSLCGHFDAAGVPLKRKLVEFRVSPQAVLPVGHVFSAAHFVPGQYVDVAGTTIGKGFQGVMKRWGFSGQPASHGNSLSHRAAGSTGACQDPGRVFKGKKMAGRMGGKRKTVQNCLVWRVDPIRNLIYVKGQVPGHKGNFVEIKDASHKRLDEQPALPIPSVTVSDMAMEVRVAPKPERNPFEIER